MKQETQMSDKKGNRRRAVIFRTCYSLTLLALMPTVANAGPDLPRPLATPELPSLKQLIEKASRQLIMPPLQYDKPYAGKLIVTEVPTRKKSG